MTDTATTAPYFRSLADRARDEVNRAPGQAGPELRPTCLRRLFDCAEEAFSHTCAELEEVRPGAAENPAVLSDLAGPGRLHTRRLFDILLGRLRDSGGPADPNPDFPDERPEALRLASYCLDTLDALVLGGEIAVAENWDPARRDRMHVVVGTALQAYRPRLDPGLDLLLREGRTVSDAHIQLDGILHALYDRHDRLRLAEPEPQSDAPPRIVGAL